MHEMVIRRVRDIVSSISVKSHNPVAKRVPALKWPGLITGLRWVRDLRRGRGRVRANQRASASAVLHRSERQIVLVPPVTVMTAAADWVAVDGRCAVVDLDAFVLSFGRQKTGDRARGMPIPQKPGIMIYYYQYSGIRVGKFYS